MPKPGPKSEAGKASVRLNAVRHGVRSMTPVIPGLESQEDWEVHLAGMMASLAPEGQLETALAERVALALWRLQRVIRYETDMIAVGQERAEDDLAEKRQLETDTDEPESVEADRDLLRDAQERLELLQRLHDLPDSASIKGREAVAFLSLLADATHVQVDLESLSVPGLPKGVDWEDFTGCTGRVLREAVNAVAARARSTPEGLLAIATRRAREQVDRAEHRLRRVVADLDRLRRDRLLPDEATLQKVIRYESHLNRQLYQALHELEALQGRRRGEQTPLARVDVQGLPEG